MFRRHFFLIVAIVTLVAMASAVAFKLTASEKGGGGPVAGGPPGASGGPGGAGPGGPGGRGGPGRGAVVTPAVVGTHVFADRLQVLGVAKGRESITLTSNTSEMVEEVHFRPGDQVQRGQVLVELRRTEEDAGIGQAKADLNLARLNAERWSVLADRGVAPRAQAEQMQATYERAKAALAAAESRAGDRVIRAPFSGVIGLSDIAAGALISPGTAIATLDDISVIRVDFDVPDRFLSMIREGGAIVATTDAYPGDQYAGRIARIDTRIDERTRTIKARAEFPNPGRRIRPGMLMRVGIDRGTRNAPAAPESAVQFTGGQAFVYYLAERNGGFFAEQRPVLVGGVQDGLVEIRDGLIPGDRIVSDGLNRVQPNQPVTLAGAEGGGGRGGGPGRDAPGRGGRGGGRGADTADAARGPRS